MSGSVGLVDFIVGLVENVLHLPNIFWTFPDIFQRLSKVTEENKEDPKMFW